MLLIPFAKAAKRLAAARIAALAVAAATLALLPACGLRYDESFSEKDNSRKGSPRTRDSAEACAVPSHRERREARATVQEMERTQKQMRKAGVDAIMTDGGASSKASEVRFAAAPNALNMEIAASERLNLVDGVPHALTLVVYHLSDRASFDLLAESGEGVRTLLDGRPFDARVVKSIRRIDVQPGMAGIIAMDRAEGGRYVAIAAGYDNPHGYSSTFVESYPVGQFMKKVKNALFISNVAMFTPRPLDLRIELGDSEMRARPTDILVNNFLDSKKMSYAETQNYLGVN